MKKLATLLLLSTVALAGCSSIQRSLRGDDYVDSSLAAEESSKAAAQSAKELNDALTNENANFPQLSKEVAEDEAEVILHTSQGDIRIKLFPKLAPLAVENFLTHAKEGYYNGITFQVSSMALWSKLEIQREMVQVVSPSGMTRIRQKTRELVSRTKLLLISITSVVLFLWLILVNQTPMAASSSSTKTLQTPPLNSLQASILRKSSKPTKKGETLV